MQIISYSLIFMLIFNFVLIVSFLIGKFFMFNDEKNFLKASNYSIYLIIVFIIYFISIIIFDFLSFLNGNILYGLLLAVFLFIPFIIGSIANYKKINFYTNIQIFALIISFIVGSVIFFLI